jgi:hypothetical protein
MNIDTLRQIATDASRYTIDSATGCWNWNGARNRTHHGVVRVGKYVRLAHRILYHYFVGPIFPGLLAHHACGNAGCVNPQHIQPVTPQGHARIHAELHGKLDYAKAEAIRKLATDTALTQAEIGEMFGVDHSTVSAVVRNRAWRHYSPQGGTTDAAA